MPTFVLNKYENKEKTPDAVNDENNENTEVKEEEKYINITGTLSEIVNNALHKCFPNNTNIELKEEDKETDYKAISVEDINNDPLNTFNRIKKGDTVLIYTAKAFETLKDEWFLTNLTNKTNKVFFSLEQFINCVKKDINHEC